MRLRLSLSGETPDPELYEIWNRFEAVGMIRAEFLLRWTGSYWTAPSTQDFVTSYVAQIASFFAPRPVWYRASDLWSDEANPLHGVDEIWEEDNPIVGRRGTRRSLLLPNAFQEEIRLVGSVAKTHPNLHLLTPFVGDANEFSQAFELIKQAGWPNRVGSMLEIPSAILDAKRFNEAGATNLMIGLNDLSCLMLGTTRSTDFDAKNSKALWWCIHHVATNISDGCEWGIAGSLSKEILQTAAKAGVPYSSIHYSELPQLLDADGSKLRDAGKVGEIKKRTRARSREFRLRKLS